MSVKMVKPLENELALCRCGVFMEALAALMSCEGKYFLSENIGNFIIIQK